MENVQIQQPHIRSGFTLIEILIALVVGALITGTMWRMISGYLKQSKVRTVRMQLQRIKQAAELFKQDVGRLPKNLGELYKRPAGEEGKKWIGGGYLPGGENDTIDPWSDQIQFKPSSDGKSFEVYSFGGSEDDREKWEYGKE